jgi:hypothetical protein
VSLKRIAVAGILLFGCCGYARTELRAQTAGAPLRFARVKCGIGAPQISLLPSPGGTPAVAVLACDEQVEILSAGERWCELKTKDGKVGYVSRFFLQEGNVPASLLKFGPEKPVKLSTVEEHEIPPLPPANEPVQLFEIPPRERSTGGLTLPIYSYFGSDKAYSGIQMLTPDEGVDFSKYLDGVVANLKRQWYRKTQSAALKNGKGWVTLQFRILRDGSVQERDESTMISSGSEMIERAAIASIRDSAPYGALPEGFKGPYIELRFTFLCNYPLVPIR